MSNKRKIVLSKGEIYHILNRSIASEEIFVNKRILSRAISLIDYYRFPHKLSYSKYKKLSVKERIEYLKIIKSSNKPVVEIFAFAFMPDHYHLLLRQLTEKGISHFISTFQNAFAKYYNLKIGRDGGIFKTPFRAKWISTDEIFLHISRYIHLNPVTSYIIDYEDLKLYPWTSYPEYQKGVREDNFINTEFLLKITGGIANYNKFVSGQVDYQRKLKKN